MPSSDPIVRSLAAKIAINSRRAGGPPRRSAPDAVVPADLRAGYHAEVDPDGVMPLHKRQVAAAAAWKRDEARRLLDAHHAGRGDDDGGAAA